MRCDHHHPLRGRRALVTGASSGLGAVFARELARCGCNLTLVARRGARLEALAAELRAEAGVEVQCAALDLAPPRACDELLATIVGPVDVLVNNAGMGLYGRLLDTPWERLAQMIALDVVVPAQLTRLVAASMTARGHGYILQVASVAAYQPTPLYAAYAGAKSFVLSFSEALAYELRGSGVSCTTLCPGITQTEFFDAAAQPPTLYQRLMMMDARDVACLGLRAMLARRRVVVPGWLNKLGVWFSRFSPRTLSLAAAHMAMR
jgi:uncharacterized protein